MHVYFQHLYIQFHRSFPGPAEVSPAEITALAQYYYDPATGLHNYLQFHNDIVSLDREEGGAKETMPLDTNIKVLLKCIVLHASMSALFSLSPSRNHLWLVLMRSFSVSETSSTKMVLGLQSFSVIMIN